MDTVNHPSAGLSGVTPPAVLSAPTCTMEYAPDRLEDLPEWLHGLQSGQMTRCWVALVIELSFDDEGHFTASRRALAAALAAVRDHGRRESGSGPPGSGRPGRPGRRDPGRTPVAVRWRALLAAQLPRVGDERPMVEIVPAASDRAMVATHLAARRWPEFVSEVRNVQVAFQGGQRSARRRFVRRVAPATTSRL